MKSRLTLILLFVVLAPAAGRAAGIKAAGRGPRPAVVRAAVLDMGATDADARASIRLAKMLAAFGAGRRLVVLARWLG